MTRSRHKSDSSEQQVAERLLLEELERKFDWRFDTNAELPIDLHVKPDGVDLKSRIVVETYARIGSLKGAQQHKVKGDILKLALIGTQLEQGWRKILCFACPDAAKYASGPSWVAEAARKFAVEVLVVELSGEATNKVVSAQRRQRMVNPE